MTLLLSFAPAQAGMALGPMGPMGGAVTTMPNTKRPVGRGAGPTLAPTYPSTAMKEPALSAQAESDPDIRWVRAVLAGDRTAFEPLVEAHQQRVYYLALRMLGNPAEAQDAAQDVFLQAYTRLGSYKPEWKFKTWVMSIASNLCIDRLRRRKIEPMSFTDRANPFSDGEAENDATDVIEQMESGELLPEQTAEINEQQRLVMQMLRALPDEDRSMLIMHYWGDMSYDEIAAATHTTVGAVKSRLFRARRSLAESSLAKKLEVQYE